MHPENTLPSLPIVLASAFEFLPVCFKGYTDRGSFSLQFRRSTGLFPTEYCQQNSGDCSYNSQDMKQTNRLPQHLIERFSEYVEQRRSIALATVLSTEGSTYSKSGNQILISDEGRCHGLVSGGCLENDLAEWSARAIASGTPEWVDYDLRSDDDVFGLGVGCEGAMRILVQPLLAETGYEPLRSWLTQLDEAGDVDARFPSRADGGEITFRLSGPRNVLVLGAGQDAEPLVGFCRALGWRVTVVDHRPAYVSRLRESQDCAILCVPVDDFSAALELDGFDAVIVMSHHLASDRQYLKCLAESSIGFIGLLGPPHRRDRLLGEIGASREQLADRLRSPVGRRIGGRGPEAIALEIAAELQEYFSGTG
jgi:xanthine/CO dehydrogenase XdhC/CoxF family maturation factor